MFLLIKKKALFLGYKLRVALHYGAGKADKVT